MDGYWGVIRKHCLTAAVILGITAGAVMAGLILIPELTAEPRPDSAQHGEGEPAGTRAVESDVLWKEPAGLEALTGNIPWQWQLTGLPVDQSIEAGLYDIDLFETNLNTVAALQAGGAQVICYISAGSWEEWRPDADRFPDEVLGRKYQGWPGESWLDIRRIDLIGPIMAARLDLCQAKGFDGVEPDNIDGYSNDTGFPLTYQDQLAYNQWLADQAHQRGLSIGLKNDPEQAADLVDYFDWALTEDCFAEGWCGELAPFIEAGKPVLAAEYTDQLTISEFFGLVCPQAAQMEFNLMLKNRELDAWRRECP